jgi:hypothetical protein
VTLPVYLDFETRSCLDLKKHGGWAYAAHPTTEAVCCYLETPRGDKYFWTPLEWAGLEMPSGVQYEHGREFMQALFSDDVQIIAHNGDGFDRAIATQTLKLPPAQWFDTMALADYYGFPGGLDDLSHHLWGERKDPRGYKLMLKLCKPQSDGRYIEASHRDMYHLAVYNVRDVTLMRRFCEEYGTTDASGKYTIPEPDAAVYLVHQQVNMGGVRVDLELAAASIRLVAGLAVKAEKDAVEATRDACRRAAAGEDVLWPPTIEPLNRGDLTRVAYLQSWINAWGEGLGWQIDAMDKDETLEPMMFAPDDVVPPLLKQVINSRLVVSRAGTAKLVSAVNRVSPDGRLRGEYRFCIAEGSPVFTDLGWVPIESLDPKRHRLWDGVEWVSFSRLIDNGDRRCICTHGVWATPDHQFLSPSGWVKAEDLARRPFPKLGRYLGDGRLLTRRSSDENRIRGIKSGSRIGTSGAGVCAATSAGLTAQICRTGGQLNVDHAKSRSRIAGTMTSCRMTGYAETGETDGLRSSLAATTPRISNTNTTEGVGSKYSLRGGRAFGISSPSFRRWKGGTRYLLRGWKLTALSRRVTTFPGMLGWSRGRKTITTDATAGSQVSTGSALVRQRYMSGSGPHTATTSPSISSGRDSRGTRSVSTREGIKVFRVFDVESAGPRNRFQVAKLIAHNCGAGPGRWSGRGVQLQNLKRPAFWSGFLPNGAKPKTPEEKAQRVIDQGIALTLAGDVERFVALVDSIREKDGSIPKPKPTPQELLGSMVRSNFIPDPGHVFVVADFSQIEARGCAWLANDSVALETFRRSDDGTGPDAYCAQATTTFGREITKSMTLERGVGKEQVLGCVAEGSPVLTERGWVPIELVLGSDRVWDGREWVAHEGVLFKGYNTAAFRAVGVGLTHDHMVLAAENEAGHGFPQEQAWAPAARLIGSIFDVAVEEGTKSLARSKRRSGEWTVNAVDRGDVTRTYDLVNCGPRHRFQCGGLVVHNCGYGMGPDRFGERCEAKGLDLKALGLTPEICVQSWRERNRGVVHLWKEYDAAFRFQIENPGRRPITVGRCVVECANGVLRVMLPSSRLVHYWQPRVGPAEKPKWENHTEITYSNYRKADGEGSKIGLFGGKILENLCQATCRDFLTNVMVQASEKQYRIAMHTHDEIILEVPEPQAKEAQAWLDAAMSTAPAWAEGFPIKGESQIMRRYGKG